MSAKKPSTRDTSVSRSTLLESDDAPELTGDELNDSSGVWRIGETIVSAAAGMQAMRQALIGKTRVNIHLDNDLIAYFKGKAGGRGYQTLINAALRSLVNGETADQDLQRVVRLAIREEFAAQQIGGRLDLSHELLVNSTADTQAVKNWEM